MIGTVLDKYEILQKVGEGGMATVYRGRHLTLGREVAIKVLHPHLSSSTRNRQRFAREARAIEHLDHANILRIFDYSGVESEDCYIVTEYIDGLTLQEFMDQYGRIPSEAAALIGYYLADALEYAHDRGIVHRDLKPENVMLRKDGTLKLMDFGIARFLEDSQMTMTGALVGSPAYMSPEHATERDVDARSDLFSLGTVLFYLVSGQLPFTGGNPSVILRNIIDGARPELIEVVPEVSHAMADVVEHLLQTDPLCRYQSTADVKRGLLATMELGGVNPDSETWALHRLITDPDSYRTDLDRHLTGLLLEKGRALLQNGEHLVALRIFNRLLAMDPDNSEVMNLVQGLHTDASRRPVRRVHFATAAAIVGLMGLVLFWFINPNHRSQGNAVSGAGQTGSGPPPVNGAASLEARSSRGTEDPLPAAAQAVLPQPSSPGNGGNDASGGNVAENNRAGDAGNTKRNGATLPDGMAGLAEPTGAPPGNSVHSFPRPSPPKAIKEKAQTLQDATAGREDSRSLQEERDLPATLRVVLDSTTWAEIYVDGEYKGITGRDPVQLSPGEHILLLRNDFSEDEELSFSVAPGEYKVIRGISLKLKPATVIVGRGVLQACVVELDGVRLGTVASLGRRFTLPDPRARHRITYRCPDDILLEYNIEKINAGAVVHMPREP